jgi:hypothetical protein
MLEWYLDIDRWVHCHIHYLTLVVGLSYRFYYLVFDYSLDYKIKFSFQIQIFAHKVTKT